MRRFQFAWMKVWLIGLLAILHSTSVFASQDPELVAPPASSDAISEILDLLTSDDPNALFGVTAALVELDPSAVPVLLQTEEGQLYSRAVPFTNQSDENSKALGTVEDRRGDEIALKE